MGIFFNFYTIIKIVVVNDGILPTIRACMRRAYIPYLEGIWGQRLEIGSTRSGDTERRRSEFPRPSPETREAPAVPRHLAGHRKKTHPNPFFLSGMIDKAGRFFRNDKIIVIDSKRLPRNPMLLSYREGVCSHLRVEWRAPRKTLSPAASTPE
jgi:hypothetical protein